MPSCTDATRFWPGAASLAQIETPFCERTASAASRRSSRLCSTASLCFKDLEVQTRKDMTMATKPKAHPEDAAKAVFRVTTRKPQDMVVQTNTLLESIKKHAQFGSQPAMQQALTTMTGITDTLAKQETDIQTSRTNLTA